MVVPADPENPDSPCVPNPAGVNALKQEMLNGHAVAVSYFAEKYSPRGQ